MYNKHQLRSKNCTKNRALQHAVKKGYYAEDDGTVTLNGKPVRRQNNRRGDVCFPYLFEGKNRLIKVVDLHGYLMFRDEFFNDRMKPILLDGDKQNVSIDNVEVVQVRRNK